MSEWRRDRWPYGGGREDYVGIADQEQIGLARPQTVKPGPGWPAGAASTPALSTQVFDG